MYIISMWLPPFRLRWRIITKHLINQAFSRTIYLVRRGMWFVNVGLLGSPKCHHVLLRERLRSKRRPIPRAAVQSNLHHTSIGNYALVDWSIYICTSICLSICAIFPICPIPIHPPSYLPTYLPIYLPTYLSTYLPTYLAS